MDRENTVHARGGIVKNLIYIITLVRYQQMNVSKLSILEFWKSHPEHWITVGERQAAADALITALYFPQFVDELPWLDAVIYCDQFMRHFSRCAATGVTETDVSAARRYAAELVVEHTTELQTLREDELMFALMVWKHIGEWDRIFGVLHSWLSEGRSFTEFPVLNRFYKDTYTKMFEAQGVRGISCISNIGSWDSSICEACPPRAEWGRATGELPAAAGDMIAPLQGTALNRVLWVSLSGGVDSNLMCALGRYAGLDVRAVHIVYGNRTVAEAEAAFVADLCAALGVTLYTYHVPWIRRATADRAFYEAITRRIRFAVYRAVGASSGICLGHIQEDVVENVWTNFAHGVHLDNLAKMSAAEDEDGVRVSRPWLSVRKADVYAVAEALCVPHLKNTTPTWSNRGKFRDVFYASTHAQYGAEVDAKVLAVAAAFKTQADMLDRLLFQPIFDSWTEGIVNVTPIFAAGGIDAVGWLRVLTHFCHARLGISKPSIHACEDLSKRVSKPFEKMKFIMKRDLEVTFVKKEMKVFMNLCIKKKYDQLI